MSSILEIDHDPSSLLRALGHHEVGDYTIGASHGDMCAFALNQGIVSEIIRRLGSVRRFFSRTHLTNVDDQQAASDSERTPFQNFFPKWGSVFAPIGLVAGFWGWSNIRDNRRLRWGTTAFVCGLIMWGYGFARLITL